MYIQVLTNNRIRDRNKRNIHHNKNLKNTNHLLNRGEKKSKNTLHLQMNQAKTKADIAQFQ